MKIVRRDPEVPLVTAPIFTGTVRLRPVVGAKESSEVNAVYVQFDADSRNLLHTHTFDQVLYILEGEGIVATADKGHHVFPGDVIVVPAGEEHWHGATPTTAMAHLAFGIPGKTDVSGVSFTP